MIELKKGLILEEFWRLYPGLEERLLELPVSGRDGILTSKFVDVGWVNAWIDECCEGADRGGYVKWFRLQDVLDHHGTPLELEADTDGSSVFFANRMGVLW